MVADCTLTTTEVARRLGVSADKIRYWITTRELRAINVALRRGGRPRWRIAVEDLAAFLAARTVTPEPVVKRRRKNSTVIEFY